MRSILIVKTSAIGDVIHTFPVVEYLRQRFPQARIDWVVEKSSYALLKAHPLLNHVIMIDSKKWRKNIFSKQTWGEIKSLKKNFNEIEYDLLIDLQGNSKSGLVTALARAKEKVGFARNSVAEMPNLLATRRRFEVPRTLNVSRRYLTLVQKYFKDETPFDTSGISLQISEEEAERLEQICNAPTCQARPRLMVAFGSNWKNKRLDEKTLTNFLSLLDQRLHPSFLFIYGSPAEKIIAERLQAHFPENSLVVGELSLPLWQALMQRVDRVIAMDSAALHLCATTATPSFSIFGPSLASVYKPTAEHHVAVQGSCPYGKTFNQRCPILRSCKTGACMTNLQAEQLLDAFLTAHAHSS